MTTTVPGRRFSLRSFVLVALFVAAQWVPVWQCWNCEGSGRLWLPDTSKSTWRYALQACPECSGRGTLALARKLSSSSSRMGIVYLLRTDTGAQETFRQVEKNLENAQTLRIRFKSETISKEGKPSRSEGTLLLKQGDKLALTLTSTCECPPQRHERRIVSDGKKVVQLTFADDRLTERSEKPVPASLNRRIAGGLLHAGIFQSQWLSLEGRDPQSEHPVDGLAIADTGQLTYRTINSTPGKAQLWFDSATLKPVRFQRLEYDTLVDTYEEFVLNGDIPDETFTLPAEK